MDTENELIEHQTITAIVENVEQAKLEVSQAFALLATAKTRLDAALGGIGSGSYNQIVPHGNHYGDSVFEKVEPAHVMITQNAWRYILAQTGLNAYMTERRKNELHKQIEDNELPALTVENIMNTLGGLAGRVNTLLCESIKEVFDWLRPQSQWGTGALKTNHKFYVGEKAIVGWAVERNYGGGFHINYRDDAKFRALGNVFSLLDGKGVVKYPNDFYTRFNEYFKDKPAGDKFEDEYFECKCYGNRNMHIRFKRADLLAKLNQIGGDGELPGQEKDAA